VGEGGTESGDERDRKKGEEGREGKEHFSRFRLISGYASRHAVSRERFRNGISCPAETGN